jgi:hypothetical protein
MGLLEGFDPFNFNPLSFAPALGAAPDLEALLMRKGRQLGGLLAPQDQPVAQPANNEPFRMPAGTQSLNSAPLPEIITGGPGAADGSALSFAPKPASAGGVPLPRPRPDGAPDDEGATLPAAPQPAQGGGGLLDVLRSNASNQSPGVNEAPSQTNPPTQPVTEQQKGPGFGDRILATMQSVGHPGGLLQSLANGVTAFSTGQPAGPQAEARQAQNLTYNALIKKNIDPEIAMAAVKNPEMLKALLPELFGTKDKTESIKEYQFAVGQGFKGTLAQWQEQKKPDKMPLSLGSGYIYNPKTEKITRAFEPEDKIPAGFAKGDDGNMHFIPGGPADPAYIQLSEAKKKDPNGVYTLGRGGELYKIDKDGNPVIVHKNEPPATEANIPDETAVFAAERILQGEKGVKNGYGRGTQGPANLMKIDATVARIAKERGITPGELVQRGIDLVGDTARERTAATQEARMSSAGIEAQGAIKLGREASGAVPRTKWVSVNKAIQAYQSGSSDPNLKKFGAANLTIINTYARAINPSGVGTVSDKEHAAEMLRTADGPEAYNAVLDQLDREIELAHRSPVQAREGFRKERAERFAPGGGSHAPAAAPKAGTYIWTPTQGLVPGS